MPNIAQMSALGGQHPVNPLNLAAVDSAAGAFANAGISLNTDGSVTISQFNAGNASSAWFSSIITGIGSSYWVRVTGSGDSPGTLNTWQQLSSARSWSLSTAPVQSKSFTGTIQISSDAAGAVILASGTFSISSTSS